MTEQRPDSADSRKSERYTTESSTTRKSRWWIWLIVAVVVVGGVAWWQRGGAAPDAKAGDPASRPVMVSTAAARQGDIGIYLNALGTVTPVYTVTVTSRVQGQITQVYYHEGQMCGRATPSSKSIRALIRRH